MSVKPGAKCTEERGQGEHSWPPPAVRASEEKERVHKGTLTVTVTVPRHATEASFRKGVPSAPQSTPLSKQTPVPQDKRGRPTHPPQQGLPW